MCVHPCTSGDSEFQNFGQKPHVSSPFSGIPDLSVLQLLRPHQPLLELAQPGWLHPQKPQLHNGEKDQHEYHIGRNWFCLMKPRDCQGNSPSSILGARCLRGEMHSFALKRLPVNLLIDCLSVHCSVLSILRLTIVITLACKATSTLFVSSSNLVPPNALVINHFNIFTSLPYLKMMAIRFKLSLELELLELKEAEALLFKPWVSKHKVNNKKSWRVLMQWSMTESFKLYALLCQGQNQLCGLVLVDLVTLVSQLACLQQRFHHPDFQSLTSPQWETCLCSQHFQCPQGNGRSCLQRHCQAKHSQP